MYRNVSLCVLRMFVYTLDVQKYYNLYTRTGSIQHHNGNVCTKTSNESCTEIHILSIYIQPACQFFLLYISLCCYSECYNKSKRSWGIYYSMQWVLKERILVLSLHTTKRSEAIVFRSVWNYTQQTLTFTYNLADLFMKWTYMYERNSYPELDSQIQLSRWAGVEMKNELVGIFLIVDFHGVFPFVIF